MRKPHSPYLCRRVTPAELTGTGLGYVRDLPRGHRHREVIAGHNVAARTDWLGSASVTLTLSDRSTGPEGRKPIGVPTEISPVELAVDRRRLGSKRDIPTVLAHLSLETD